MWDAQRDSSGDPSNVSTLSASLEDTSDGWNLTLTPDMSYLTDPQTQYPVTLDPTIVLTSASDGDNYGYSGNTTDESGDYRLLVGTVTSGSSTVYRSYMNWNTGQFVGENVTSAELSLYQYGAGSCSAQVTRFYPTSSYSNPNTDDVTINSDSAWYNSPNFNTGGAGCSSSNGYDNNIDITKIVNAWDSGEVAQYGMQLRASPTESDYTYSKRFCSNNSAPSGTGHCEGTSGYPSLAITYTQDLGQQPQYPQLSHQLNDRSSLAFNTRNGNASLQANDIHLGGRGIDLSVDRVYNSLDTYDGDLGTGWRLSVGADVYLSRSTDDRWDYSAPGGMDYGRFVRHTDSGHTNDFYTPKFGGLNVDLHDNGDGTFTMTFHQSQEKYTFDDLGCATCNKYLTKITDKNGNEIDFGYNSSSQLTTITDTHGRVFDVAHNTVGEITSISERSAYTSSPRTWTYHYNSSNQLDYYIDPTGARTDYGYINGLLTSITDPAQASGARPTTDLTYSSGQLTAVDYVTDSSGDTDHFTYSYDSSNSDAESKCNVNSDAWDFFTTVTDTTDPHGGATKYCFKYRSANPSPTDPNVNNVNAPELRVIDANGHHRSASFDPGGSFASTTAQSNDGATNGTTSYSYNDNNDLTQATQPQDSSSNTPGSTFFDYTGTGAATYLPTSSYTSGSSCTSMSYDTKGNLTNTYTGQSESNDSCAGQTGGRHSHVDYNTDGTPSDSYGPVAAALPALTGSDETRYSYYASEPNKGELEKVVRPGGNYSCTTDRTGCTTYQYDGYSRVTQVEDGNGNITNYTYDKDDRVTAVMTAGATSCTPSAGTCVQYAYDGEGNLTSRTDATGTTTFTYDRLNRPSVQTQPNGTTITTVYDGAGNLTSYSQHLPGKTADTVTYSYDGANQLTSVTDAAVGTFNITSDSDGRPTKLTLPSSTGVSFAYGYTPHSGKLNAITPSPTSSGITFGYNYNTGNTETGKVHSMDRTVGSGSKVTTTYDYDSDDHLKDATPTSGTTYSYAYDADANLRSSQAGSSTTYYGYNENDQLCWSGSNDSSSAAMSQTCAATPSGDTTYTSDAAGNDTGTSSGPIVYNAQNQATQISSPSGSGPVSQTYTDQGNNLRLTAGSDSFITGGPLGITARVTGGYATYYIRTNTGQLLAEYGASGTYYYETDRQDSVVALVDSTGAAAATYAYTPYGAATISNGTSTTAGQNNPWRYTGGYQDPTDGYYHLGARYYDTAGHFTQADPVAGSLDRPSKYNGYTYTAGDPINNSDLSGRDIFDDVTEGISDVASAGAAFADAAGAPEVGAALGAVATVSDTAKTAYDCSGAGESDECGTDVGGVGLDLATAGAGKAFGDGAQFFGDTISASYNAYNTFAG